MALRRFTFLLIDSVEVGESAGLHDASVAVSGWPGQNLKPRLRTDSAAGRPFASASNRRDFNGTAKRNHLTVNATGGVRVALGRKYRLTSRFGWAVSVSSPPVGAQAAKRSD